jgi:hypothetical protein
MKIFVWLAGQSGPYAQLWYEEGPMSGEGKAKVNPLFQYKLTDEEEQNWNSGVLTLNDLMIRFVAEIPENKEALFKAINNPPQPNENLKKLMQE